MEAPYSLPALADLFLERARRSRWAGARAHAGGVGLGDADGAVDAGGRDAEARGRARRHRRGRRDEGIRAVVDVEQRGLRALEQHRVAARHLPVQDQRGVADARRSRSPKAGQVAASSVPVDLGRAAGAAADLLVVAPGLLQLRRAAPPGAAGRPCVTPRRAALSS